MIININITFMSNTHEVFSEGAANQNISGISGLVTPGNISVIIL